MPLDSHHDVDSLVIDNLYLVAAIVRAFKAGVPTHVRSDDLASAGMLGLVLSAQSYDESRGVPFKKWAELKIHGAIVDELRSMDWASRSVRVRAREVEAARNQLAVTLGRSPRSHEVAETIGVSISELGSIDADVHRASVLSLQGFSVEVVATLAPDHRHGPERQLLDRELLEELDHAIAGLPERLRRIVQVSYFEGQTMAGLAAEFGLTESRISQLRQDALKRLRAALTEVEAA